MEEKRKQKITSPEVLRRKIEHYCVYQERCQQEVRNKLYELGAYSKDVELIIAELIEKNFLNEERFAIAFAGGKFRIKKWGKLKIIRELKMRQISAYCIKKALQQIEEDDYEKALIDVLKKKLKNFSDASPIQKMKLAKYAMQKGFEPDLIWKKLKENET
jgi:regulatory protein